MAAAHGQASLNPFSGRPSATLPGIRVATIPDKVTPTPTLTPAKSGSELTPATPTPLKSRNLPYIVAPNPESDSENSRLQATPTPGSVATLVADEKEGKPLIVWANYSLMINPNICGQCIVSELIE